MRDFLEDTQVFLRTFLILYWQAFIFSAGIFLAIGYGLPHGPIVTWGFVGGWIGSNLGIAYKFNISKNAIQNKTPEAIGGSAEGIDDHTGPAVWQAGLTAYVSQYKRKEVKRRNENVD